MKREIESARARAWRTAQLAADAQSARDRLDTFRTEGDGPKITGPGRERELEHDRDLAENRLRRAQTPADAPADADVDAADDHAPEFEDEGEKGTDKWWL